MRMFTELVTFVAVSHSSIFANNNVARSRGCSLEVVLAGNNIM